MNASGRPDESLVMDFVGPLQLSGESGLKSGQLVSISLHKGQLRANVDFQPCHSASLEVLIFKYWAQCLNPDMFVSMLAYFLALNISPKVNVENHSFHFSCFCGPYL